MPISSGANGWPIRHFKQPAPAPEPKLKKFINVIPNETLYNRPKPTRPPSPKPIPAVFQSHSPLPTRKVRPLTPSPPPTPDAPRRKRYTPPPSPEPGCCGEGSEGGGCCGIGGACGRGCCSRMCGNSVCCWTDDAYRKFGQRGTWWSRGVRGQGCCGGVCCRRILALLLGLLLLLLLLAALLALIFGIQAYNRSSTVTIINGKNVYYSVLGKYQNCTDPAATTVSPSNLPSCNTTTTVLATTPAGFTPPYSEPTTAGDSTVSPLGGVKGVSLVVMLSCWLLAE